MGRGPVRSWKTPAPPRMTVLPSAIGAKASDARGPVSQPTDYVAPPSGGAPGSYRWRRDDETPEQFHERIAREDAAARSHPGA